MNFANFTLASLLSVAVLCSGCGSKTGADRVKTFAVKGKVTYSGGPLVGANIAFAPREGQPIAMGRTNDLGEYTLTTYESGDGAAAGRYMVVVKKVDAEKASAEASAQHGTDVTKDYGGGHSQAAVKTGGSLIPGKYGDSNETPLTATVEAGKENAFDFDLN